MKRVCNYQYDEQKNEIGRGAFSRVYLATHVYNPNNLAAVKVVEFKASDGKTKHLLREVELMRHLHHVNVVRLIDVEYERFGTDNVRIFLVMEYCAKGDLNSVKKPLPEEECRVIFRQIFSGLRYLKSKNIIHRDLKAANILVTSDGTYKLADFTFSTIKQEHEIMSTLCGTPLFLSAQVLLGEPYTDKCDLYSVGVILYTFLYGSHPMGNVKTFSELVSKVKTTQNKEVSFPQKLVTERYEVQEEGKPSVLVRTIHVFSPEVVALIKGLLKYSEADRISWEAVFVDPWLQLEPLTVEQLFSSPSIEREEHSHTKDERVQSFSAPVATHARPPPVKRINTMSRVGAVPIPGSNRERKGPPGKPLPTPPITSSSQQGQATRAMSSSPIPLVESNVQTPPSATDEWGFHMSDGVSKEGTMQKQKSRLILDYYNQETLERERQVIQRSVTPPRPVVQNVPASSAEKKLSDSSFLTRSMDKIHQVFSL